MSKSDREMFLNAFYQGEMPTKEHKNHKPISQEDIFLNEALYGKIVLKKEDYEENSQIKSRKRSKYSVDSIIDLHGNFQVDAKKKLLNFIAISQQKGLKKLLVIHGKGSGALKGLVYELIKSHCDIIDYEKPPSKLGGQGAVIIYLKLTR